MYFVKFVKTKLKQTQTGEGDKEGEEAREGRGEGAISGGKPVLVAERYWLIAWRCSLLSQRGLSPDSDRVGSRFRTLELALAGQCRMACSNVSASERQWGHEVSGSSDHQEGWAAR